MNIDLFASIPFDRSAPAQIDTRRATPEAPCDPHDRIGHALGWDHARYDLPPPVCGLAEESALWNGWRAGRAVFGRRTLAATPEVRQWLSLRQRAWLRGDAVELLQVNPQHLRRIQVTHCPVLRQPLIAGDAAGLDAVPTRLRSDAAYAAGHLAVLSAAAHAALGTHRFEAAVSITRRLESDRASLSSASRKAMGEGLNAAQWGRLAVLCSFVEPLSHQRACELPMLVLPPNRLRLLNPVQALQAFISRQLMSPGWSRRISALEALVPGASARRAFRAFFQTWLARVLEAGRPVEPLQTRWAIEDAWRPAAVMQRWVRFAQLLDAQSCEALLTRAMAARLAPPGLRAEPLADACATEGWQPGLPTAAPLNDIRRPWLRAEGARGIADRLDAGDRTLH